MVLLNDRYMQSRRSRPRDARRDEGLIRVRTALHVEAHRVDVPLVHDLQQRYERSVRFGAIGNEIFPHEVPIFFECFPLLFRNEGIVDDGRHPVG